MPDFTPLLALATISPAERSALFERCYATAHAGLDADTTAQVAAVAAATLLLSPKDPRSWELLAAYARKHGHPAAELGLNELAELFAAPPVIARAT